MIIQKRKHRFTVVALLVVTLLITMFQFNPVYGEQSASETNIITDLVVNDDASKANWSVKSNLQVGDVQYGDRDYTFTTLPENLAGNDWIKSANDAKKYTGDNLVSFKINADAYIYVAYDSEIQTTPSWLEGWSNTGVTLTSTKAYKLFRKRFSAGAAISLGNNGNTDQSVYSVIAIPISKPQVSVLSSLVVNDAKSQANWSICYNFQEGDVQYGDRDYTFTALPENLAGNDWIKTANDAKYYTGDVLVSFKVNASASIYVAYDSEIKDIPAWLKDWIDTGASLTSTKPYKIFTKKFSAGDTVSLGDNGNADQSVYTVIAIPSSKPQVGVQTSEPTAPPAPDPVIDPGKGPTRADKLTLQVKGEVLNNYPAPVLAGNIPLVSLRGVSEAFGAKVEWDSSTGTEKVTGNENVITLSKSDLTSATLNDKVKFLDAAAKLDNSDFMVPYTFVCDALGLKGVYNYATGAVSIDQVKSYGKMEVKNIASTLNDPKAESYTNDGKIVQDERWSDDGDGKWIAYDLGTEETIGAVSIAWYDGNQRNWVFEIEVSSDNKTWKNVHSAISKGKTLDLETFNIPEVKARYVRYLGHGNAQGSTWNSVTELNILGIGGTPIGTSSSTTTKRTAPMSFFVSPYGSKENDGSRYKPWDIITAFSQPDAVIPGDTIFLRGGTYRFEKLKVRSLTSYLEGTDKKPITVKEVPGEHAVIDVSGPPSNENLFVIKGKYTNYYGIEVTDSNKKRITDQALSFPSDLSRGGIDVQGSNVKLINMVIHDCANGIGTWAESLNSEIYGCIIYNNGWEGPDRGHGHAVYIQNKEGTKKVYDNIMFNQFAYGIHGYTAGGSIQGFDFQRNVSFNNGSSSRYGFSPNLLVGGDQAAARISVTNNYFYSNQVQSESVNLGYAPNPNANKDVVFKNNYVAGSKIGLYFKNWLSATVTGNKFVGNNQKAIVQLDNGIKADTSKYIWDKNTYYESGVKTPFINGKGPDQIGFEAWKSNTGFDKNSKYYASRPKGVEVFVNPNKYEKGRANIVIYNWDLKKTVDVDVSKILKNGDQYEIRNAQDFYGDPVATGKYNSKTKTIKISTKGVKSPEAIGWSEGKHKITGPEFNVYVLIKK